MVSLNPFIWKSHEQPILSARKTLSKIQIFVVDSFHHAWKKEVISNSNFICEITSRNSHVGLKAADIFPFCLVLHFISH